VRMRKMPFLVTISLLKTTIRFAKSGSGQT
jgi:hypothetical protein